MVVYAIIFSDYSNSIFPSASTYAYVFCVLSNISSLSRSFIMLEILSCGASIEDAAIIASLLPFAPACARPLRSPKTIMFSPAITSAPSFTSPNITRLPSNSTFCPDLTEPL